MSPRVLEPITQRSTRTIESRSVWAIAQRPTYDKYNAALSMHNRTLYVLTVLTLNAYSVNTNLTTTIRIQMKSTLTFNAHLAQISSGQSRRPWYLNGLPCLVDNLECWKGIIDIPLTKIGVCLSVYLYSCTSLSAFWQVENKKMYFIRLQFQSRFRMRKIWNGYETARAI